MAYGSNPATSTSDALRLAIGDTSTTAPLLQDAEVAYFIVTYGANLLAASHAANAIKAKYAIQVTQSSGEESAQLDQLFQHFKTLAEDLLEAHNRGQSSFTVPSAAELRSKDYVIRDSRKGHFPPRQLISDIQPETFRHHRHY